MHASTTTRSRRTPMAAGGTETIGAISSSTSGSRRSHGRSVGLLCWEGCISQLCAPGVVTRSLRCRVVHQRHKVAWVWTFVPEVVVLAGRRPNYHGSLGCIFSAQKGTTLTHHGAQA